MVAFTLIVRDGMGMVLENLMHHIKMGASRVYVTDHGSVDGTTALLEEMAVRGELKLFKEGGPLFKQADWTNRMVVEAGKDGCEWVVPGDVDEFWMMGERGFEGVVEEAKGRAVVVERENVLPEEEVLKEGYHFTDNAVRVVRYKGRLAPESRAVDERESFFSYRGWPKVMFPVKGFVGAWHGNHRNPGGGEAVRLDGIRIDHFPIGTLGDLEKRASRVLTGRGWHINRWGLLLRKGELGKEFREKLLISGERLKEALQAGDVVIDRSPRKLRI